MRALFLTLFVFALLSTGYTTKAQKLFLINKSRLQTNWHGLLEERGEDGVIKGRYRFCKDDKGYYFELAIFRHPGKRQPFEKKRERVGIYFTPEDKIQFTLLMNKGIVSLPVRDTTMIHSENSGIDFGYIRFAATEPQLNDIIQNKSVNITFTASGEKVEKELNDDINFDLRSAASAIVTQRDIRGEKLRTYERTLTGKALIEE
jgi:hypothetical protein